MKFNITKNNKVNILGLTVDEADAIIKIVTAANNRCFRDEDKYDNGAGVIHYFSGDNFVCTITEGERKALSDFSDSLIRQLGFKMNYN